MKDRGFDMYGDFYEEFMIYWLLPELMAEVYGGADKNADTLFEGTLPEAFFGDIPNKEVFEGIPSKELFENENMSAAERTDIFEFLGQGGVNIVNITDVTAQNVENAAEYTRMTEERAVWDVFEYAEGVGYEREREAIYKEVQNRENTLHDSVFERPENGSVYDRIADSSDVRIERESIFSENSVMNGLYGGKSGGEFERGFARLTENAFTKEETSERRNEFVINIGGITQNISGGTEIADIGEAVAKCLMEAVNTTAEGAF